jgi:hypothetical protein
VADALERHRLPRCLRHSSHPFLVVIDAALATPPS